MLRTQNKTKFSPQNSKLLKVVFFMICGIFFTTTNASLLQTGQLKGDSSYFLDEDSLQLLQPDDDYYLSTYIEKENPSVAWVFIPIWACSIDSHHKVVANVVGAEFHKRIDEHLLVPPIKFLIRKSTDNNHGYQLIGSVYKKFSFATPIIKIMHKKGFDDYANNMIYKDYNIEHSIAMWDYLGLPIGPNYATLELSEDNKLVRYDYYNSFQYVYTEIYKKCFCTSDFSISDYNCDTEHIEIFKQELQELRSKHKKALKEIISKIDMESKKYLEGWDLDEVSYSLKRIMSFKFDTPEKEEL
jgi:hypothetical protein